MRFDYGDSVPWVTRGTTGGIVAIAGPEWSVLRCAGAARGPRHAHGRQFTVAAGERVPFVLTHGPSHLPPPPRAGCGGGAGATDRYWSDWSARGTYDGRYAEAVSASLLVLKALTYTPTGGIAAAATTSLPEQLGGSRNWDYRYCWLRDAALTLFSLMNAGYFDEAGQVARLAASQRGRQPGPGADHVRHRRRAPAGGVGGRLAARLPGRRARADRQRRRRAVAAGRVRRGDGGAAPGAQRRPGRRRPRAGTCNAPSSSTWKPSGSSRTTASGRRAAAASTSPTRR